MLRADIFRVFFFYSAATGLVTGIDCNCKVVVGHRKESVLGLPCGNFCIELRLMAGWSGSNEMMRYLFIVVFSY
jgi:hypothetical protein